MMAKYHSPYTADALGAKLLKPRGFRASLSAFFGTLAMPGLMVGFICFYISMMPMLLPRTWLIQAVCSGVSAAIGYAVGKLMAGCSDITCYLCRRPALQAPHHYRLWLTMVGIFGVSVMTNYQHSVMEEMRALMAMDSEPIWLTAIGALIGLLLWLLLVVLCRWLVLLIGYLVNLIAPQLHLPIRAISWVFISVLVGSVLVGVTRYYLWQPALQLISQKSLALDISEPKAISAPTDATYRSGVNGVSAQDWEALGHYGQRFVALGLDATDISAVTGLSAKTPIRVFVGLDSQSPDEISAVKSVKLAMTELDRTDAWSRQHLVIHGATGRGWVEEYSSLAAEYLTDGDIASVAVQYSYLPSQVSFMVDRQASSTVNRLLFRAIRQKLDSLPADSRPKLYLAGESLGALATQSNFSDYRALTNEIDGAVWVGTPRLSHLWETLVGERHDGTTEGLPIIERGQHVRFMDYPETLSAGHPQAALYGEWISPRIVFIQYASDPIVWWSPNMAYTAPDWMREPAGRDIARVPMWLPILSLWELSLDMPASNNTPAGHGHIYRYDSIHAWQAVLNRHDISSHAIADRIDKLVAERDD